MSLKPEKIPRRSRSYLSKNSYPRARRYAKMAATRLRRLAERLDPENAPARFMGGWID